MKRILSVLIIFACLFSFCSGCKVSKQAVTLDLVVNGSTQYTIVRSDTASFAVCEMTNKLRKAMSEFTSNITVSSDYLFENMSGSEYEIIIGNTNRAESHSVLSTLKYDDYKITIIDKKIVIAAYDEAALDAAVTRFIEKVISRAKDGNLKFTSGDEYSYKHKYSVKNAKIGGVDLKDFEIVLPSEQNPELEKCAEYLKISLRSVSGIELNVVSGVAGYSKHEIKLENGDYEDKEYSISVGKGNASIASDNDEFTMRKAIDDFVEMIKKKGKPSSKKGVATSKKLLTSACFSDAHNSLAMLTPNNSEGDYVLRKTHTNAINLILGTRGKVDVVMVGGDLMSDFPHWNKSGKLPYEYYQDFKKLVVKEYARLAKDEKVMYVAGNHDYAQGELSTDGPGTNGSYNSSEFYFSGPMNEKMGELSEIDMHWITGAYTGEKYLLGYHYEENGVHFIGISPDPDSSSVRSVQDYGLHPDTISWFKSTLDRIDPNGNEIIFVNCHYILAYRSNDKIVPSGEADKDILPIIKDHSNLFWMFGHVHSGVANIAQSHTSEMIVHYDSDGEPCSTPAIAQDYTKNVNKGPTTVYMGAGRIGYSKKYFGDDVVTGNVGYPSLNSHPSTATPTVCQVMYFTVYEDRVEFQSINVGTHEGYTTDDIIEPYTVYLY